ncbi:hypothetical protein [Umezawaea tangerina]|uniref:Uncharacterized protein n=1 Tax=Umezawaea tangerina TaxID=84725 RepID=A0A2T0TH59_9PSEU|nr:hypothetical protein [Umezawaea tangerina]PRY44951.1 hypothetical protein CLV43_102516 [Umezawaea tangerina]
MVDTTGPVDLARFRFACPPVPFTTKSPNGTAIGNRRRKTIRMTLDRVIDVEVR